MVWNEIVLWGRRTIMKIRMDNGLNNKGARNPRKYSTMKYCGDRGLNEFLIRTKCIRF